MPPQDHILRDSTTIAAPIERCFLLSTHIDTVRQTLALTPVAGRTSGHVVMGDRVTWRGWKFFLPQVHHTLITQYREPTFFQDTQERGRFARFRHDHHLTETIDGTLLEDEVRFALPFGPLGRLVARVILIPHIRKLLRQRFALLKRLAETDAWKDILPSS
jgi:ligand-binding SRPBCC domain-containing protein